MTPGFSRAIDLEVVALVGACSDRTGTSVQTCGVGPNSRKSNVFEHADDRVRLAAERDALADDVRVGVEARFPQATADDRDLAARAA